MTKPGHNSRRRDYRRKLLAAVTVPALLLSACSALPRDTDPQLLRSYNPEPDNQPIIGPTPGQEPDLLLRDFYSASAIPAGDYEAARTFLTESAAESWSPEKSVLLVDAVDLTTDSESSSGDSRIYNVRGSVIGSLRSGGRYVPENSGYEAKIEMTKVDGEWRIADLPDGVVFERTELRNQYQPQSLYFFDQTGQALVNDRRWLYTGQESLGTELITLLMQGPSEGLQPATSSVLPREAKFLGVDDGVYQFAGMSKMNSEERTAFGAQLVWLLSNAGVQAPYRVEADGNPLIEGLEELNIDDFAEYNPRVSANTVAPLYALNEGSLLRVSTDEARPVEGELGKSGRIQSADITEEGHAAAVLDEGGRSQLVVTELGGSIAKSISGDTMSRPTFEMGGQAAWVVVDGDKVVRAVRSSTNSDVVESEVNTSALDDIDGEISVLRLSRTGTRVAMIIGGNVFTGVVERRDGGDFRIGDVQELASELGSTALSLDWQADGSLIVGTSTPETPVWRLEQDGSSATTLPSGNISIPVVSVAASPSTIYLTDYHAMLQLPIETDSTYWREVPGLQGQRSAPIVAN